MKKDKKKPKYNKFKFIVTFIVTMSLFAIIRHGFAINITLRASESADSVKRPREVIIDERLAENKTADETSENVIEKVEETVSLKSQNDSLPSDIKEDTSEVKELVMPSSQMQNNGHKVIGVHSWTECFPDSQALQIESALANGIKPCANRKDVDKLTKQHKLVNITNSPFYSVDDLQHSMPYLVPKAQQLLNTICYNFVDSLQAKGLPLHKLLITSALRTTDDVTHLQKGNKNATTNSCHCYGTTVDITYNRFVPIKDRFDPKQETTNWDLPMKQVLAEVLRDLREQGQCYVKYEKKQACFHLTVR